MNMNLISSISGGMHPDGINLIYELAKESPTDRILELGSFVGKSAIIMATALKESNRKGTIICCDRFAKNITFWGSGHPMYPDSFKSFWEHAQMAKVADYLVTLRGEISWILRNLQGMFGMIYIDGGHTIEHVLPNALYAWEHLVDGGILLFDDYDRTGKHKWKDVKTAVDCLLVKWNARIYREGALMVAVKK